MTSIENLKCIFCNEVFNDKEILQEHFRKHGDPEFNKGKVKPQNEVPTSTEKSAEENELVGCDVCEEVFPSISKAITHKHKMHPEHDAKYFCPWCGKLFTMKHLYNVHIKSSHYGQTSGEVKDFHCDKCSVYFFVPSAMLHHNKFFHRQDKDLYTLGSSKKVKMFNQELVSIFYCPFCGEEYNNKVNLQKHMEDDHSDENQSPEDVLRCPLCEAVLYHLDAYELHLTFHSAEDQYSEANEMVKEISEFSLEAVPPLMEKVEDANMDSSDNFLQLLLDSPGEPKKVKSKKHKKHKKAKKETITLDEFLNMNKDVFGDGLNVQGIEEVPTQMVLKRKYVTKKSENNETKTVKQDLAKLKKQGIVIKTNSSKVIPGTSTSDIVVHKKELNNENLIPTKISQTPIDPNDVISKLMSQGNNQIKIVKTSAQHNPENKHESYQSSKVDSSSDYDTNKMSGTLGENKEFSENESNDPITKENFDIKEKTEGEKEIENKKETKIFSEQNNEDDNIEDYHDDVNEKEEAMDSDNNKKTNSMQSLNLNKSLTIKPVLRKNASSPVPQHKDQEYESYENTSPSKPLSALKGLSKQITITPSNLSPSSNNHHTSDEEENEDFKSINDDDNASQHSEDDSKISKRTETPSKQENIIQTNADILKRLTNVIAKPVQSKRLSTKVSLKTGNNIPKTTKKDLIKSTMENDIEILHIEDSDSDADTDHSRNQNFVHKTQNSIGIKSNLSNNLPPTPFCGLGKNEPVKSTSQQSTEVQTKNGQTECRKTSVSRAFESKNINITNSNKITEEQKSLQKTINNLRNITIKKKNSTPLNFEEEHSQSEDDDEYNETVDPPLEDEEYNSDTSTGKVQITEMNEDEISDNEIPENRSDSNVKVESPSQSFQNSEKDEDDTFDEFNIETELKANAIKKINQPKQSPEQQKPINFPNINKEITIKPARQRPVTEDEVQAQSEEPYDDSRDTQTMKDKPVNQQQMNKSTARSSQKASSNQVNTVKSVKRYQSQTVIEEVTTTVTKTIRTVNTQEVKSANQTASRPIRPQRIMQIPKNPIQSAISRQAPLAANKIRNCGPQIRPTVAKPSNMLVPTRPRLANPQIVSPSIIRKLSPVQSGPRAPNICHRPLRPPPSVAKRATKDSGHFSCFKKPKESLFPADDTTMKDGNSVQFSSTQSISNVTQVQKGGVSQMRSETSTSSQQHLSKLIGVSGLKIVKTSSKQATHVEEKCEMSAPKNSAMAALEKLQKQGLLIKKPRLETTEGEYHSQSENEEYDEGEEN